jgi:type IV pilus assembly protein PilQ
MRKLIVKVIAVIMPFGILIPAMAFAANLKNIEFSALPSDKTEIRLTFDGTPPKADGYTIEQPARIAIDLPGVKNKLTEKSYSLGYGNARNMTVVEAQGRTRLIVSLGKLVPHTMRTEGNTIYLLVGDTNSNTATSSSNAGANSSVSTKSMAASQQKNTSTISNTAMITPTKGVQGIDFKRGDNGAGNVIITLGDPHTGVDINQVGNKIKIVLGKANLPNKLRRRMDVVDFATPVQFIDAAENDGNAVITIEADGTYEQMTYQTDDILTLSVKEISAADLEKKKQDNFDYSGDKLSLNFQDIEVRSVLQLIADFTGLNLVASDTVTGRITLRLQNVPWDQALALVLKTKGLDQRKVGNVLLVAPAAEITAREKLEIEAKKQTSELAPLRSDTVRLRYAKAADVEKILGGCKKATTNAAATTIGAGASFSSRGSCVTDARTNTMLITDTADNIDEIRRVISIVDIPVRQVLIEARIVTANVNYVKDLGVEWTLASAIGNNGFVGGNSSTLQLPGAVIGSNLSKIVRLPAAATSGMSLAYLGSSTLVGLQLSAMESADQGEIVSQPRVITADGHKANIESGQEIAYTTTTGDTSNTEFKNADLSLTVTPQITPDDRIIMDIQITNDQVGSNVGDEPSIDTQSVETQALVKNGETIVLGGIFKTSSTKLVSKVPLLGDMPVIGSLFRHETDNTKKSELLIFITPKILKDDLAIE